MTEDMS